MFPHNFHKNIKYISVNKCNDRNFYCPKNIDDEVNVYKGGKRFINLNGEYDFAFFRSDENFSFDKAFEKVNVPMVWQCYGKGDVCYVNDHYLFDLDYKNFRDSDYGVYRKKIYLNKKEGKRYYLNFEGKDSCLYLYINNKFVGFDSVSHCTSEFDVTDYLKNGENELLIFVYAFCIGSYFECQDKFRLSGLFRDIYILEREEKHIESYKITYKKIDEKDVKVHIEFISPCIEKIIKVLGTGINLITKSNEVDFVMSSPKLWNAEEPNLYILSILANNEQIYDYLSFRFIEIKDKTVYLNGRKIKILGVNHHDSKYETGYYLNLEDYKRDIDLIKNANMNGVRTSHYPPAPEFLYLCDENGIYVIDEADIECHGAVWKDGDYDIKNIDYFTDNEEFDSIIKDRIDRLYSRDFNRQCVLFWSTGNEAGLGKVMIKCLDYLKKKDPSRLVHYESLYTSSPERNHCELDVISKMYPSIQGLGEIIQKDNRPIVLCEYSHAMGNSSGDIYDYVNYFFSEDQIIGGFIWEFNDHLFPINSNLDMPGYGGDFKEKIHSNNFCVDGLVDYKRLPTSNYYEVKAAYARIQITKEHDSYYLVSRFDFVTKSNVEVYKNNEFIGIYSIKPKDKIFICKGNEHYLNFKICINGNEYSSNSFLNKIEEEKASLITDGKTYVDSSLLIENSHLSINISKHTGLIEKIALEGKELINDSCLRLLRAPIDNDQYEIEKWKKEGLFNYITEATSYAEINGGYSININCSNIARGTINYRLSYNKLIIGLDFEIDNKIDYLPRFGFELCLDNSFKNYSYLGFGPFESYCDKYHLDKYGYFKGEIVSKIPYIKPQECLSHLGEEISISNNENSIYIKGFNSFSYLLFSIEELMNKKHNYDLSLSKSNHLILDYKMSGIGSHSCGPELNDIYKLKDKKISYELILEVK